MTFNNITTALEKREEILMPEEDRKILRELYLIRSYSGFEDPLRAYLMSTLDQLQIPYINYNGNILGFNHPRAPLFSAHMDMVNTEAYKLKGNESVVPEGYVFTIDSKTNIRLYRDKEKKIQTSLGADDKNGIWVILMLLRKGYQINFAFCHSEEIGGAGSSQVVSDKDLAEFIEGCRFGIIIDRKNKGDIIGYQNKYCMVLDDHLESFAKGRFPFTCARGSISDADRFSQLIECVNISCGYYEPHTSREYTNLNELWTTLQFCEAIYNEFEYVSCSANRIRDFKSCNKPYSTYKWGSYGGTHNSEKKEESHVVTSSRYYANKKEDEKKISQKTTKMTGTVTGTTTTTDTKNDDPIAIYNQTDMLAYEVLIEAMDCGAAYHDKLGAWVVPLYSPDELEKVKVKPESVLMQVTCPSCERNLIVTQESFDELAFNWYNGSGEKVIGICTDCCKAQDITSVLRYYL